MCSLSLSVKMGWLPSLVYLENKLIMSGTQEEKFLNVYLLCRAAQYCYYLLFYGLITLSSLLPEAALKDG